MERSKVSYSFGNLSLVLPSERTLRTREFSDLRLPPPAGPVPALSRLPPEQQELPRVDTGS